MAEANVPEPGDRPRLIALDWGTSNLRASLLGEGGRVLDARSAAGGVMAVPERRFAEALLALCGDWIEAHHVPLIASGMIGSRQGWQEAPYLECPAGLADAAARLTRVKVDSTLAHDIVLHIVPGLHIVGPDGLDDVMRGEETQLWGAELAAGRCAVLPGTHSKWAWLGEGWPGHGLPDLHDRRAVRAAVVALDPRPPDGAGRRVAGGLRTRRAAGAGRAGPAAARAVQQPHRGVDGPPARRGLARSSVRPADRCRDRRGSSAWRGGTIGADR
jgi:hypothetical protein